VQDIKYIVDHVRDISKKDKVVLIGHSAGGGMSQKYTEKYPESVAGLVTVGAFPPFGGAKAFINWTLLKPWASVLSIIKNDPKLLLGTPKIYKVNVFCVPHNKFKGCNVFKWNG
jgi:pimeloyl-ACP methyl ester carboxylesterase